jgi:hypothetical protein
MKVKDITTNALLIALIVVVPIVRRLYAIIY